MTSATAKFWVTYNFIFYPKLIEEYSYKYIFYDTVEKELEIVKFIHRFLIIKEMDLSFKETDSILVSLLANNKTIKTTFIHNFREIKYYVNIISRGRNSLFMKDFLTGKWYGTRENLFHEATNYATEQKHHWTLAFFLFFFYFYEVKKKSKSGYVMGTLNE